jgi:hypothetical protein
MSLEKHEKKLVETVEKAEKPHEKADATGTELDWGDRVKEAVKKGKKNIEKVTDFMEEFESSGEKGRYGKRKMEEFQKKIEDISGTMEEKLSAKKEAAEAHIDSIIYDIEAESTLEASTLVNVLEEGVDIKKAKHLKKHQEIVENIDLPKYKKLKLDFALALAEDGDKKAEGLRGFFKKNRDLVKSIIGLKKVPQNFTEVEMEADLSKLMQLLGVKDEQTIKKVNDNLTIGNLFANQNLRHLTQINGRKVPQSKIYDRVVKNKMKLKFTRQLTLGEKRAKEDDMAKRIEGNPEELIKDFGKMERNQIRMTLRKLLEDNPQAIIDNLPAIVKHANIGGIFIAKLVEKHATLILENSNTILENGGVVGKALVIKALKKLKKENEANKHLGQEELALVTKEELEAVRKAEVDREDERRLAVIRERARGKNYKRKVKVTKQKKSKTVERGKKKQPAKQETTKQEQITAPAESKERVHGLRHVRELKKAFVRTDTTNNTLYAQIIGENILYHIDEDTGNIEEVDLGEPFLKNLKYAGMISNGEYIPKGEEVYKKRYETLYKQMLTLKEKFGKDEKKDKEKVAVKQKHRPMLGERVKVNKNIRSLVQAEDGTFWRVRVTDKNQFQMEFSESKKGPWYHVNIREIKKGEDSDQLVILDSNHISSYKIQVNKYGEIKTFGSKNIANGEPGSMSNPSKPENLLDPRAQEEMLAKAAVEPIVEYLEKGLKVESDKKDPEKVAENPKLRPRLGEEIETKKGLVSIVEAADGTFWRVRVVEEVANLEFSEKQDGPWHNLPPFKEGKGGYKYDSGSYDFYDENNNSAYSVYFDKKGVRYISTTKATIINPKNLVEKVEPTEAEEKLAEKPKARPRLGKKIETNQNVISLVEAGDGTFWRVRSLDKGSSVLDFSESKNGPWYELLGYKKGVGGWKEIFNFDFYDKDDKIIYRVKFDGKKGIGFIGTANVGKKERGSLQNLIRNPENLVEKKKKIDKA